MGARAAFLLANDELDNDLPLQLAFLHHLPVSAWTLKPDGTPDFVNEVWLQFAGQTLEFVRSHPEAWMAAVHPEDRERAAKSFWQAIHAGQNFAIETRSLRAKDKTYRWHLQQAVVLRNSAGNVLRFVGTTTDIDDQKRAEEALRQAQRDIARINRLTTMGELTASLAHEIRQPIAGAITNAKVCLRKLGNDEPDLDGVHVAANQFLRDVQRAAEIITRIHSQFQLGSVDHEIVSLGEIVEDTVAILRDEARRYDVSMRLSLAGNLPDIVGDRVQLQQVVMNLIVNSIEAMKEIDAPRKMTIKSQYSDSKHVLVSVSDVGIGFPPQLAERIFDPFFTSRPRGTGMGLRVSRSIIEFAWWALMGGRLPGARSDLSL